jgi:hypothetical protein
MHDFAHSSRLQLKGWQRAAGLWAADAQTALLLFQFPECLPWRPPVLPKRAVMFGLPQ